MEHDRWGNVHMHSLCGENMRHGHRVSGQYFVLEITDLCNSLKNLLHPLFAVLKVYSAIVHEFS